MSSCLSVSPNLFYTDLTWTASYWEEGRGVSKVEKKQLSCEIFHQISGLSDGLSEEGRLGQIDR